jgi:hypothetical protein
MDAHSGRLRIHADRLAPDAAGTPTGTGRRRLARLDIPALAALLHNDITLTMPTQASQIVGRDAVAGFFATRTGQRAT